MEKPDLEFAPGTLLQRLKDSTKRARRLGAIHSIDTEQQLIEEGGVRFVVRSVSALARKDQARGSEAGKNGDGAGRENPFLPYDPDVFVANISPTHVGLLNKFNVIDHHLLIVTRAFEHQETLLSLNDFGALWTCMAEFDGLAFYNGGTIAGASQPHKHLQMLPLPLAGEGPGVAMEPILQAGGDKDTIHAVGGLPFAHAFTRLDPTLMDPTLSNQPSTANTLRQRYLAMLEGFALTTAEHDTDARKTKPYNLLVTRKWMLLVPRSRECFASISINALGFAGSLFVRDTAQVDMIRRHGPMTVLQTVGYPAGASFPAAEHVERQ